MPTNLTGSKIKDTYGQLLHVDGGPEATEKVVRSGTGVATALSLGTGSASVDNIKIDGNTISSTNTNGNINLTPNGTGVVVIPEAEFTTLDAVTFNTVNVAAGMSISNGTIAAQGTNTNIDITLTPKGTGVVSVPRAVVSANSTSDALRITQVGTGNALVVEDSTNPDATPFVVDASGNVGVGTPTPPFKLVAANSTTDGGWIYSSGTTSILGLGSYSSASGAGFSLRYDRASGDTTFNTGTRDTPVERMRLFSNGIVAIGTSTPPNAIFNVTANTTADAVRITQTGTGNALVVEDSANPDSTPFVVDSAGRLVAGYTASTLVGSGAYLAQFMGSGSSYPTTIGYTGASALGPKTSIVKNRSADWSTNTVVQNGDSLGDFSFTGADGTGYIVGAQIATFVDGTPGTNDMPGRLVFSTTADGASTPTERMRISSTGLVTVAGTLESATVSTSGVAAHLDLSGTTLSADGTNTNINITISPKGTGEVIITKPFGYGGSGTGGTVTQLTSRTTGVTLDKLSGQITLFAATSISGHGSNEFTLTNSFIDSTDVVHVCFASGLTAVTYGVTVTAVNTGSCKITVSNFSNSATPADTPVLNFVVIKGVNA